MGTLRLMSVLAHPDDETLALGGVLAKYASEGVEVLQITATRGEVGWPGPKEDYPGPDELGRMREGELREAARVLGLHYVSLLDYHDGQLDQADPARAAQRIAVALRRWRPQVVVTFDPYGVYGHPDHIAISQYTASAVVLAASAEFEGPLDQPPHQVAKLYYRVATEPELELYQYAFGELAMTVNEQKRSAVGWPDWAITTVIETGEFDKVVWQAVDCYRTQITNYRRLMELPEPQRRALWSRVGLFRVFSLVNGGSEVERDLFAGLRDQAGEGDGNKPILIHPKSHRQEGQVNSLEQGRQM